MPPGRSTSTTSTEWSLTVRIKLTAAESSNWNTLERFSTRRIANGTQLRPVIIAVTRYEWFNFSFRLLNEVLYFYFFEFRRLTRILTWRITVFLFSKRCETSAEPLFLQHHATVEQELLAASRFYILWISIKDPRTRKLRRMVINSVFHNTEYGVC
jgi:hypothetical protein